MLGADDRDMTLALLRVAFRSNRESRDRVLAFVTVAREGSHRTTLLELPQWLCDLARGAHDADTPDEILGRPRRLQP